MGYMIIPKNETPLWLLVAGFRVRVEEYSDTHWKLTGRDVSAVSELWRLLYA